MSDELNERGDPRRVNYFDERRVEAEIFGDRGDEIGTLTLSRGQVFIEFDSMPVMTSDQATADLLAKKVGDALRAAVLRVPGLADPHSTQ